MEEVNDKVIGYGPIFPEMDIQYDDHKDGVKSYVRVQRKSDNKWFLVLVITRYNFNPYIIETATDYITKGVKDMIQNHVITAYRVLHLFIVSEDDNQLVSQYGTPIGGILDDDQRDEVERIKPIY